MNELGRSDNHTSFRRSAEDVEGDVEEYHDREYIIRGLELDGGFGIGLSYAGDGVPPDDIVPVEVYQSVAETVRSRIAIEEVQRRTTPDVWPQLGTCHLSVRDDGSVEVQIELRDLGTLSA